MKQMDLLLDISQLRAWASIAPKDLEIVRGTVPSELTTIL